MTTVPRERDLEIEQDADFQRREWRLQRVGRLVMLAIILAALAGVFGAGPVASASTRSPDGRLEVRYHRIARHGAPEPLSVRVLPRAGGDSIIELWVNQRYMHGLVVHEISPEPTQMLAGDERLVYRFHLADASRAADIVFQVDARTLWARRGAMGLVNGDSVRFRQFVFP